MPSLSPFGLPQVQVAAAKCLQLNAHPLFCNYLSAFRGPEMPVKQLKISASAQFNQSPPLRALVAWPISEKIKKP